MPIAVIAIGGNSLLRPGERGTIEEQRQNLEATCEGIAAVVAADYRVVITHGNGPQVGAALLRSEAAADQVPPLALDVCDAETQGSIGYLLQQTLQNTLGRHGLTHSVVTMVTQVLVSMRDPAFREPSKPVGPFYTRAQADERRARLKWQLVEEAARGYRRVVPSPEPKAIVELLPIERTLESGALVIACGGGGIPVILHDCQLMGVEAVIDKDRVSALLASQLGAELFLLSTSVDEVALNFGTPEQQPLHHLTADKARRYLQEGQFPPGSMGPKIEAALQYLERGGREVIITSPGKIGAGLEGKAGTRIAAQLETAVAGSEPGPA